MCACVPEVMYSTYQDREQLEDDLYQEDEEDSEGSEANSELEFHLYSQLHYSSNTGELEELEKQEDGEEKAQTGEDRQQDSMTEATDVELKHIRKNKPPKKQEGVKEEEKKKKDSKAQKSQSLFFEEVIVIDSSPDVITVSDDDSASSDDDVGICAMKGQYARPMQTSTPAQQESQKRKIILEDLVTLSSSSSETESESECESKSECESESDASDSSDSDCLESWMIIGQGGQDGDQSISLNLEGGYDDNADAEDDQDRSWVVCDKDKEAQIYNKSPGARIVKQQMSNRYYTDKNVHCRNCDKMGHLSKSCTVSKKTSPCYLCGFPGHLASQCPNKYCNNCGLPGHHYGYCSEKPYYYKQCFRCNMKGHYLDACPEIWRQYHMTTSPGLPVRREKKNKSQHSVYCYNCSKKGHFGHDCTQRRMFSGVFPTNPFINHYDFKQEIKHREARLKKKVNEMVKNGYFPTFTDTPTPEQPKKKQKISHNEKNAQPAQRLHQTPQNNKSIHFFFDDSVGNGTPKIKRFNKCEQQGSTGTVKPWKPKRPVPTSRNPLPENKSILDEPDDFPRGGKPGFNWKMNKIMKKNKVPSPWGTKNGGPDSLFRTGKGQQCQEAKRKNQRTERKRIKAPLKKAKITKLAHD